MSFIKRKYNKIIQKTQNYKFETRPLRKPPTIIVNFVVAVVFCLEDNYKPQVLAKELANVATPLALSKQWQTARQSFCRTA